MTIVSTQSVCAHAVDADVQAGVVDALVFDARERLHAALLEQRAPDPSGRLRKAFADLARLALQQPHFARTRSVDGRLQAATLAIIGVDAPFVAILVDRVAATVMRQEFADVEPDAAGTDDRDPRTGLAPAFDDVDVGRDAAMLDAGNRRSPRKDSGGEHDVLERREVLRGRRYWPSLSATPVRSIIRPK